MILEIILFIAGCLISWLITDCYYKKSLKNQENELSKELNIYKEIVTHQNMNSKESLRLQYIDRAVEEYKRRGTPVRAIDTFDISENEKADIYDAVMMRCKGRLGKNNKYRKLTNS